VAAFLSRTDSASANNPALNLTGDPSVEITFLAQTPTGGRGDLILEPSPAGGVDPDTQVLRDNQDENPASIRMRTQFWPHVGRA